MNDDRKVLRGWFMLGLHILLFELLVGLKLVWMMIKRYWEGELCWVYISYDLSYWLVWISLIGIIEFDCESWECVLKW